MTRVSPRKRARAIGIALVALAPMIAAFSRVAGGGSAAPAASANAYEVTFVARQCPSYGDITSNLARNNIQESL
ncbi:MAG TPA: hypothetical protein VFC03_12300 [Acidimicrobiales bacterium]|nr:hypothetical protein [Acidimicrobiales bacterium]